MIKLAIEQKQLSHLSSPTQVTNGNWSSQVTLKSHCNPEGEARGLQLKLFRVTSGDQVPLVTSED